MSAKETGCFNRRKKSPNIPLSHSIDIDQWTVVGRNINSSEHEPDQ